MDEASVTTLPDVLVESPQDATNVWSMSVDVLSHQKPYSDLLALPECLNEMPGWLQTPLRRYLRLKQRNWPAKTVQRSTRQLFYCLERMTTFFIQRFGWSEWCQLSPHWLEDYIDAKLQEGKKPCTINWNLIQLRAFCLFLIDENHPVPESILRMKLLNTPRRLPRPLSGEQVRRLECCIQTAVLEAKTDFRWKIAIRYLTCFYLLWHCGLRTSEVCSLQWNEIDIEARKLFIRNSKERKDRVVYMSDTAAMVLQQHLAISSDKDSVHLFPTLTGIMTTRTLERCMVDYGNQCGVQLTPQRLRHTFATQMLAAGVPVTSLQRYLGHEHLDTTMLYAEVSDPLLRQDYYQGISALDPQSENLSKQDGEMSHQDTLRQLVKELKTPGLEATRRDEIVEQMQLLLESAE